MKFKLDENLPRSATEAIRQRGHDALSVLDQTKPGAPDSVVAEMVRSEDRALVTLDLDFADIRAYDPSEFAGIVVLRPRSSNAKTVLKLIERALDLLESETLHGHLWIVEERRVRVRPS